MKKGGDAQSEWGGSLVFVRHSSGRGAFALQPPRLEASNASAGGGQLPAARREAAREAEQPHCTSGHSRDWLNSPTIVTNPHASVSTCRVLCMSCGRGVRGGRSARTGWGSKKKENTLAVGAISVAGPEARDPDSAQPCLVHGRADSAQLCLATADRRSRARGSRCGLPAAPGQLPAPPAFCPVARRAPRPWCQLPSGRVCPAPLVPVAHQAASCLCQAWWQGMLRDDSRPCTHGGAPHSVTCQAHPLNLSKE